MRKPLIVGSIVVHAAAFAGLAVAAMWHVDKLPMQDHGGVTAQFQLPHDSGGGAAPKAEKMVAKKDRPKIKVKDVVQPDKRKDEQKVTSDATSTEVLGDSTEGPIGNGTGGDGEGKLPPGDGCAVPPCQKEEKQEEPPLVKKEEKKVVKKPVIIEQTKVTRIAGDSRIEAPNSVKQQMQRADQAKVIGTIKLCADTRGAVTRATVSRSTGYDAYDDRLVSEMSDWRYEPLVVDGEKTAFCTYITLVYIMR